MSDDRELYDMAKHAALLRKARTRLGEVCERCKGEGWLEPIGPCADGSYITSRLCPDCDGDGVKHE